MSKADLGLWKSAAVKRTVSLTAVRQAACFKSISVDREPAHVPVHDPQKYFLLAAKPQGCGQGHCITVVPLDFNRLGSGLRYNRMETILERMVIMDIKQLESSILGELWASPALWDNLTYLCDACNGRFAGTDDERRAGDFLLARFKEYGLENIGAHPFQMRGWERGTAQFLVVDAGRKIDFACIALPGSPGCDFQAEVVDVGQGRPEDYQKLRSPAAGKIILTSSDGPGRGEKYRTALEAGAAGFIFSGGQPGMLAPTGSVGGDLPAIGLAHEHALRLQRMLATGPCQATLTLSCSVKTVTARNICAEIPGSDPKQGWILACGHYDGHDIAQGAGDNAAGTAVLLEAARLLARLRDTLQSGIRFVLFSGEELGLFGSYAYARDYASELNSIRAVVNVDVAGLAMPLVLRMQSSPALAEYFRRLPLQDMDLAVYDGPGSFIMNSDHIAFSMAGIQAVWAVTSPPASGTGWGHTSADTLDKLEPRIVRQTAGAAARLLLRMAVDAGSSLPSGQRPPDEVKQSLVDAGFEQALRYQGRWPFDR